MWSCQEPCKDFTSLISHSLFSLRWNLIYHHGSGSFLLLSDTPYSFIYFQTQAVRCKREQAKLLISSLGHRLRTASSATWWHATSFCPGTATTSKADQHFSSCSFHVFAFGGNVSQSFLMVLTSHKTTQQSHFDSIFHALQSFDHAKNSFDGPDVIEFSKTQLRKRQKDFSKI